MQNQAHGSPSEFDWDDLQEWVLRESFNSVTAAEAVILVGLLHTCRIYLSSELRAKATQAGETVPLFVHPLTLEDSESLVTFLFGQQPHLRQRFENDWAELRHSERAQRLRGRLEEHRLVESMVDLPVP